MNFTINQLPHQELMKNGLDDLFQNLKFAQGNITDDCFYRESDNYVKIIPFKDSNEIAEVQNYCDIHKNIPLEIKLLYMYIANKNIEASIGGLTFFNFKEFTKLQDINADKNRLFIDIAISYAGMGHLRILSYSTQHQKYFVRMDGGSNGWVVKENDLKYDSYIPDPENDEMVGFKELVAHLIDSNE